MELDKKEIIEIVDDFINQHGLWSDFKAFLEEKGYKVTDLGFPDED